jgi:serine/threonine protein kinase
VSSGRGGPYFGAAVVKVALEGVKGAVVCLEREIKILSGHASTLECLPHFFGDGTFDYSYRCMAIERLVPLELYISSCSDKAKTLSWLLCGAVNALDNIHHHKFAHLDIKKNNVMIRLGCPHNCVVLIDFGCSFTCSISSKSPTLWKSGNKHRSAPNYFSQPPFLVKLCKVNACHAVINLQFLSAVFADFFLLSVLVLELAADTRMQKDWLAPKGSLLGDIWRQQGPSPWLNFVLSHDATTCSTKLLHDNFCTPASNVLSAIVGEKEFCEADVLLTDRMMHLSCYEVTLATRREIIATLNKKYL